MGPLAGIKIVELAGIGPAPMCAMLLADLGATVLRVDKPNKSPLGIPRPARFDLVLRGRKIVEIDLKKPDGVCLVLDLVEKSDAFIEGFRPGVSERMGLGPEACMARNPKLVYGRVTGWGQDGPLAMSAGHDLNYISITGVLDAIGRQGQPPSIPLQLVGDYAGGALYLAMGLLAGILEARSSGQGQVVDAAMVDGVASLATLLYGMNAAGIHRPPRGTNILDGGSPFYAVYECSDGKWISIAPLEPKFFEQLLDRLGIEKQSLGPQYDPSTWTDTRAVFSEAFRKRTQAEWIVQLTGTDVCFAPVLDFTEALDHPHLVARRTFIDIDGVRQPAPAPRFSRTPPSNPEGPANVSQTNTDEALAAWIDRDKIAALRVAGTIT
jgi:alpha-methylacyl-CoA racemase